MRPTFQPCRLLAAMSLCCACAQAPRVDPPQPEAPHPAAAQMQALGREFANLHRLPGLAIGVVQDGKLAWHGGFSQEGAPAPGVESLLRLGSVTKVLTAQAMLLLRDRGKLGLDDPVAAHVPELAGALSAEGRPPVRIRHLLTHTSGIPSLRDGTLDWTTNATITESALLGSITAATLGFEPGTQFDYSNAAVALAGVVISRASGRPCRDFITDELLKPLGMNATVWEAPHAAVWPGHTLRAGRLEPAGDYWRLGAIEPAGGLHSTVQDMARFIAHQTTPGVVPGPLRANTVSESQREVHFRCGYGWMVGYDGEVGTFAWHNGSTHAHGAWVACAPETGVGVVILLASGELAIVEDAARLGVSLMRVAKGKQPLTRRPVLETPATVANLISARLRALLAEPEDADVASIFSAEFLQHVPERELRQFFAEVSRAAGGIVRHEVIADHGNGQFDLKLHGKTASFRAAVMAGLDAPHLIQGLSIEPD